MARVLVVDDEPDIRDLVTLNLRLDGHEVTHAGDGEQALVAAARDRPELIVLDVMMPVLDGFAVLECLKADGTGLAGIPVIMLTARSDRMDRIRGGIEGAVVYLVKPFSVAELRQRVRDVLGGGPEEGQRRQAAHDALADLARVESGAAPGSGPRPHLTRLEPHGPRPAPAPPPPPVFDRSKLTARQLEVLDAAVGAPSLTTAARTLGVSRSFVYASLARIAATVGLDSGPEALRAARAAAADDDAR